MFLVIHWKKWQFPLSIVLFTPGCGLKTIYLHFLVIRWKKVAISSFYCFIYTWLWLKQFIFIFWLSVEKNGNFLFWLFYLHLAWAKTIYLHFLVIRWKKVTISSFNCFIYTWLGLKQFIFICNNILAKIGYVSGYWLKKGLLGSTSSLYCFIYNWVEVDILAKKRFVSGLFAEKRVVVNFPLLLSYLQLARNREILLKLLKKIPVFLVFVVVNLWKNTLYLLFYLSYNLLIRFSVNFCKISQKSIEMRFSLSP